MLLRCETRLSAPQARAVADFLNAQGLIPQGAADCHVWLEEQGKLLACGQRRGSVLECVAVAPEHQGEGLLAQILTGLTAQAARQGIGHLFLFTKTENRRYFEPLGFHAVAQTPRSCLMENRRDGLADYLAALPRAPEGAGTIGAVVAHCNPLTNGHLYLIETAASACGFLYVFVLSEESGTFPAADRLALVRAGTAHLENVAVAPTGPYLVSRATFPEYFFKDRDSREQAYCALDVAIFGGRFCPALGITRRFAGSEPNSALTRRYNETMARVLPEYGVAFSEIPRLETGGEPISASRVRALMAAGRLEEIASLVPECTMDYLRRYAEKTS